MIVESSSNDDDDQMSENHSEKNETKVSYSDNEAGAENKATENHSVSVKGKREDCSTTEKANTSNSTTNVDDNYGSPSVNKRSPVRPIIPKVSL